MPRTSRRFRIGILVAIVVLILLLTSLRGLARFYTDYLWFHQVGFLSVFRGVLVTRILLAIAFSAVFFALMWGNLIIADRSAPLLVSGDDELVARYRDVVTPRGRWVRVVTALIFALFAGISTNSQWRHWDLFWYHVPFGIKDPQFHKDIGFYVFELPFIKFILGWAFAAVVVVLLVAAVAHYLNGGIRFQGQGPRVTPAVKTHISVLLGVLALIKAVGYYYQRLELVLSRAHVVDGATATSVNANKPADTLLIAIAVIAAALFLYNIRAKGWTLPVVAVVLWGLVWLLVGNIYPALYQALRVNPSELTVERPYIKRNIQATRAAYGITNVKVHSNYAGNAPIASSQINGSSPQAKANRQTLANVRLIDPTQLTNTFDKYQALRTFYQFNSLNVDRYPLNVNGHKQLTSTVLAVRELNSQVPGGFVNQKLTYTHGYGAVLAPAGQSGINPDGTPNFTLKNIPPTGTPQLSSTGSQVYYGQGSPSGSYVIADSKQPELDYEDAAGHEVSSHYAGTGGVKAAGVLRRLAFALRFGDANFLLSNQVTSNSRVMFFRNIQSRVQKAAPFLKYGSNPYAVVLNGKIYWVINAYTTSDYYPYSQQANTNRVPASSGLSGSFNYVRNSVKVVVSAYTGNMHFFVVDNHDPIIRAYERAFPGVFTPVSQADRLIPGITSHWRYPEDLFRVQTNMYGRYHLTSASAFYSQANAWTISQNPGSGRPGRTTPIGATIGANGKVVPAPVSRLNPQYMLAHLPGHTHQSFMMLQPFVPVSPSNKQQNLTAIMTASSGSRHYGQLRAYETPPNQVEVEGPDLVVATINANPAISAELSLLNQQGSQVELGQVVTVPLDQTLLYVQPVYVQSSANKVPVLKDVIVVYNGHAYHSKNASLDNALCRIANPDGSHPFARYCNTAAASNPTLHLPNSSSLRNSTSKTTPSSTSTSTTSTTLPAASAGQSVQSLLAKAATEAKAAHKALQAGNLAAYQQDVNLESTYVAQALHLADHSKSATTTKRSTTTTATSTTAGAKGAG